MPAFGSASHTPSLRKQEDTMRYSRTSQRKRFSVGRLIGDPFALASISIAILAWLIAIVASIIAATKVPFPNFAWWTIAYMFCSIIGVILMVAGDAIYTYHVAAVGFLACGLFLTTSSVNATIYSANGAEDAAAAGFILLSIVAIIWIFYFGSQPQASHRQFIDSFALHKSMEDRPSPRSSRHVMSRHFDQPYMSNPPRQYNSGHLPGFETSSPVMNQSSNINRKSGVPDHTSQFQSSLPPASGPQYGSAPSQPNTGYSNTQADSEVPPPTEYPYKARAIYPYEANVDDPNEISFAKHEILQVSDVSGRWWQAKKDNGETGIAPSNYLILL